MLLLILLLLLLLILLLLILLLLLLFILVWLGEDAKLLIVVLKEVVEIEGVITALLEISLLIDPLFIFCLSEITLNVDESNGLNSLSISFEFEFNGLCWMLVLWIEIGGLKKLEFREALIFGTYIIFIYKRNNRRIKKKIKWY